MAEDKKVENRFELVEVPTETGIFIKDNQNNVVLDDKAVLVEILNELHEIKKNLG